MKDQTGKIELLKSHIDTYTRKDGTIVQAHDDKRMANPKGVGAEKAIVPTAAGNYTKPAHVKTKADEFDHLSKTPAEKRSPEMKARLKKLAVDAGMGKHSPEYKAHVAGGEKSAEKKPVIRSNNEGQGFHGEAMDAHIREQHGPDTYHGSLSEKDHTAAVEAGHKKFAEAADHLVSAGHFENHDQAREYLDSKHGRHLHDGASFHGGDLSKVAWLKKDVADFKKAKAGGST